MLPFNQYITTKLIIAISSLFISGFTANVCNFNVRVEQFLRNEGFHRNISYHITIGNDKKHGRMYKDCILALDQALPSGAFANPDELGDLRRLDKLNAIPKNKINIELPAEQSEPSGVYILSDVTNNKVDVWLPVHARYHMAAAGGGSFRNNIGPPKLYLRCPDRRLDPCTKAVTTPVRFLCSGNSVEKCNWKKIPFYMVTDTLIWHVPVGNINHYHVVAIGTAIVVVVGSLYLLKTIHEYKVASRRRRL